MVVGWTPDSQSVLFASPQDHPMAQNRLFTVALAGGLLEFTSAQHGGDLLLSDFHFAWIVVMLVGLVSVIPFFRLPPDAGGDVSGHRIVPPPKSEVAV